MEKAILSWSSGKDCAMALHYAKKYGAYDIVSLFSTVTDEYERISMHGVRRELVRAQAESIGIPLHEVPIPVKTDEKEYSEIVGREMTAFKEKGVTTVLFGDLFLEDLKKWRENNLVEIGMKAAFPIWKKDTTELMREHLELGFGAVVSCVDTDALDSSFAGRVIDESFIKELPSDADPCGENGEFHSFAFKGPIFRNEIKYEVGEKVLRDERFMFCDLLPVK